MTKKRHKHKKYRPRVSPSRERTALEMPGPPRPYQQVIERGSPAFAREIAERHRLALADVKRSLIIGGAMFALLIIMFLFLG